MGIATVLAIIIVLILVTALYVAAEFAVVAARKTQLAQLAEGGNRMAATMHRIVSDPHRLDAYVATCQVGITLSSLILGAVGQANLPQHLSPLLTKLGHLQGPTAQAISATIILIILTVGAMVLGELIPKTLALQMPTRVAMSTLLPMRWSQTLLTPFIGLLNGSSNLILKLMRMDAVGHQHIHSPDEIVMLISESAEAGHMTEVDHLRLKRAAQLSQLPISQIIVPRTKVDMVPVESTLEEVMAHLTTSPYTRVLVYENGSQDEIIGLVHTKDILSNEFAADTVELRSLIRPVLTVPPNIDCQGLLVQMREKGLLCAIVMDEFGGLEGLVTVDDLLSLLIGDTADEYKADRPHAELLPDGQIRTDGRVPLHEITDLLGSPLSGDAATIGGLVIEVLGEVPKPGALVELPGCIAHVQEVDETVITRLVLKPVQEETD